MLRRLLPPDWQLVCPLTLGNHVDHQLVRQAAERIGRPLCYYADLPYGLKNERLPENLVARLVSVTFPISIL
jgi:hypothetical protein